MKIYNYSGNPRKFSFFFFNYLFFVDSAEVTLFLGATAGMRLLMETNPDKAELLFQIAREEILKFNLWKITENGVRTLTETEEAVFSWISANINENVFGNSTKNPIGALDLGYCDLIVSIVFIFIF